MKRYFKFLLLILSLNLVIFSCSPESLDDSTSTETQSTDPNKQDLDPPNDDPND